MPIVRAQGKVIDCATGANLRQVLLKHGVAVHNGAAAQVNCRGLGTCGTCAVEIAGTIDPPNWREQARLALPPHAPAHGRRLACQVAVSSDLELTKYDGFWSQGDRPVWTPTQELPLRENKK